MFMFVRFILGFMLVATSIFLILLVLIQRGRGGGLAGALGGMGGQSAFGTKLVTSSRKSQSVLQPSGFCCAFSQSMC